MKEGIKMNKGFTLIELIGTIVILAVISLIAFPSIINLLNSSNQTIDEKTQEFIKSAALDYVNDNKDSYQSSITVQELVNQGYLSTSIICDNCKLENDKISIEYNGQKYTATYSEEEGGTCPNNCE